MKKIIIALVVLAAIAVGTYYLVFSNSSGEAPAYTPPAANNVNANTSPAPEAPAATNVAVEIKNFSFPPAALTVKTGTKVTWTNNDSVSHTITSDSAALLNSETLSPGQSFSFTFANAGSTNYHCSIHPTMKGSAVVIN